MKALGSHLFKGELVRFARPLLLFLPLAIFANGKSAHAYPYPSTIVADYVQATASVSSTASQMGLYQAIDVDSMSGRGVASASADIDGEHRYIDLYPQYGTVSYDASASAVAAAATGTLKLSASSEGDVYAFGSKVSDIGSSAYAYASMLETLHFYGRTGPITAPFPATVVWEVHGSINALIENAYTLFNTGVGGPQWFISDYPYYREPYERKDDLLDGFAYFSRTVWMNPASTAPAWGYDWWTYDPLDLAIHASITMDLAEGWANFLSTGQFSIIVPEEISWVSTSGVFLSEVPGPGPGPSVPEPATIALFGLGLAGIGAMRRKKPAA